MMKFKFLIKKKKGKKKQSHRNIRINNNRQKTQIPKANEQNHFFLLLSFACKHAIQQCTV